MVDSIHDILVVFLRLQLFICGTLALMPGEAQRSLCSRDDHWAGFTGNPPWDLFPKEMRSPGSWSTRFPIFCWGLVRGYLLAYKYFPNEHVVATDLWQSTLMELEILLQTWPSWQYIKYISMTHASVKYGKSGDQDPATSFPLGMNLRVDSL